jgi:hypothetical protein
VKLHHALLIASLAVASTGRVIAQSDWEPLEFVAYVQHNAKASGSLSENEHLLIFDRPVQIPGAKLSAGAYIFNFVMPSLIRVSDDTRARVYSTFFVIPVYRPADDDGRERMKFQQAGDESPRIMEWHIPGRTGYEFRYEKPKRSSVDRRVER